MNKTSDSVSLSSSVRSRSNAWLKRTLVAALAGGLGIVAASARPAQPIVDPGFEDPAVSGLLYNAGPNWTSTPGAWVVNNAYSWGISPYGNQWLDLTFSGTSVSQAITGLKPGKTYVFSVSAADAFGSEGDLLTLSASGGATGSQTFALPANTNPGGVFPYAVYTLSFTPSSTAPVTLIIASTGASNYFSVDNLTLSLMKRRAAELEE